MATCAYLSSNTTIRIDGSTCELYFLEPSEYLQFTDFINKSYVETNTLELVLGFDVDWFSVGFMGVITLFITGLGVGMIIQQLRKMRP